MLISLVFGLIVGAISVIFALQNIFPVTVTFMIWNFNTSLAVIIALAIFVGIMISVIFSIPGAVRNIFTISHLKKENEKLSEKIDTINKVNQQAIDTIQSEKIVL